MQSKINPDFINDQLNNNKACYVSLLLALFLSLTFIHFLQFVKANYKKCMKCFFAVCQAIFSNSIPQQVGILIILICWPLNNLKLICQCWMEY